VRWALQPLLELRRRQERAATGALGQALARWREAEARALALRRQSAAVAARALRAGTGVVAARWAERLRQEAQRLEQRALDAEGLARQAAGAAAARRESLRQAARDREVVERLEAVWRQAQAREAARRSEAALDDRPWPAPSGWGGDPVSASRPG